VNSLDRREFLRCSAGAAACTGALWRVACADLATVAEENYDVVVYGGTSSGVVAAVQAARMGKSVVLIEPGRHLGGMLSGGLSTTEIGEGPMLEPGKKALGGIAREFNHRIYLHYAKDDAWVYQQRQQYRGGAKSWNEEEAWWMFEPHGAEKVFSDMIREAGVSVAYGQRLDLDGGVRKKGSRIVAITMESGRVFRGRVYIDATYEGDLMAKAGVSYTIGREPNSKYGETLNGVQAKLFYPYHQFTEEVDAYVKPGDPSSGLLPGVHGEPPGEEGAGDRRVQAYCFRMCFTDVPENSVPFPKPEDYNPLRYELLFRYYEAGFDRLPLSLGRRPAHPNRKHDVNNVHAFSTDNIGMNYDYPDGDYATRERIIREHASYQKGLLWTLANHPRIPEKIRRQVSRWGLAKDEFTDNDNWPHQLYIREARRMISDYVMTENNCCGLRIAPDSIGLGTFPIDSHNVQRYVDKQGHARNEGNVQSQGVQCQGNFTFPPYPISYRSIVPKTEECTNLLVPVCLSASHIGFCSLRLEPTFMLLGQSAATAAVHAIEEDSDVQSIEYARLRTRLLKDGQVLDW